MLIICFSLSVSLCFWLPGSLSMFLALCLSLCFWLSLCLSLCFWLSVSLSGSLSLWLSGCQALLDVYLLEDVEETAKHALVSFL